MPRKSKYQLELEERRRNPGGYIGEAMDAAKPRRKPRPFVNGGVVMARCELYNGTRSAIVAHRVLTSRSIRRFQSWLADAADWVEEGR